MKSIAMTKPFRLLFAIGAVGAIGLVVVLPAAADDSDTEVLVLGEEAPEGAPVVDFEVTAQKFKFTPPQLVVPPGSIARIKIHAADHDHGFELGGLDAPCVKIERDETVVVEVYLPREGIYDFECCKYCGSGHRKMKGRIVVE